MHVTHRMTGIMGGAAKVAKKASMKDIQDRWKDRWWGRWNDQILSTLDLWGGGGGGGRWEGGVGTDWRRCWAGVSSPWATTLLHAP